MKRSMMQKRKIILIAILAVVLFLTIVFPYSILSVYPVVQVKIDTAEQQKYNEDFAVLRSLFEGRMGQPDHVVTYSIAVLLLYQMEWLTEANHHMWRSDWEPLLTNVQSVKKELISLSLQEDNFSDEAKVYLQEMIEAIMEIEGTVLQHTNGHTRKHIETSLRNLHSDIATSLNLYVQFWQTYYAK